VCNTAVVHNDAVLLDEIDLTDLDQFAHGFPHPVFTELRRAAPVWWHPPTAHTPDDEGFWSVHTHAECMAVIHDPVAYSSETGGDRPYGGTTIPDLPVAGMMLNMMDDPRHQRVRMLVSKGLTPRTITRVEDQLRRRAAQLVDDALAHGTCDFMTAVAGELPMLAICMLLGIPEEDRHQLFEWIEHSFDFRDDREAFETTDAVASAAASMFEYGTRLIAEKRARPADDMLSVVCHATLAGEEPPQLTDQELQFFFSLLWAAGADTTRTRSQVRSSRSPSSRNSLQPSVTNRKRCPPRSKRSCAGPIRPRTTGAPRPARPSWAAKRSGPETRSCSGRHRRTATSWCSTNRSGSTSAVTPTRISGSGTASITVSGPTSHASRSASS